MKIWAKFAFVYFVDFFVDFFPKTGKNPQMDFCGGLGLWILDSFCSMVVFTLNKVQVKDKNISFRLSLDSKLVIKILQTEVGVKI